MESAQEPRIRKITAAWTAHSWRIESGYVYVTFNGITLGFNVEACNFPDWLKPTQPLNLVLEIPCPPSPNTNPTTEKSNEV